MSKIIWYRIWVAVIVHDLTQLREYAAKRAADAGMSENEFVTGEHDEPEANVRYWLGWAFDSGTPENCGFNIEDSGADYEGEDLV